MSASRPFPAWPDVAAELIAVAARRAPADLVIRDCAWVNVHSREVIEGSDVAIRAGRFASCGPEARPVIGPETRVIDAGGRYLIPGLCDGHMHVESGMLTVTEFARAVMPHGTTTMFVDPHEVANVLGLRGVRLMHDEAAEQPINVYVQMPACAPSAPGLETTGAELGPADVAEAMGWPLIVGLGEMMNYPGVVHGGREDARRDRGDATRRQDGRRPLREPGPHRLSRLCRRRPRRRPRGHARGRRDRAGAERDAGDAAPRVGLVRREGADHRGHREGARPAQLHPLHRRLPLGHAGQ